MCIYMYIYIYDRQGLYVYIYIYIYRLLSIYQLWTSSNTHSYSDMLYLFVILISLILAWGWPIQSRMRDECKTKPAPCCDNPSWGKKRGWVEQTKVLGVNMCKQPKSWVVLPSIQWDRHGFQLRRITKVNSAINKSKPGGSPTYPLVMAVT